jgi:hypothetical protein
MSPSSPMTHTPAIMAPELMRLLMDQPAWNAAHT